MAAPARGDGGARLLPVFVHFLKQAPARCYEMNVPSYDITVSKLVDMMFTQQPHLGWHVELDGPGFALCHVEEPADKKQCNAAVSAVFEAMEPGVLHSEPLTAFQSRGLPRASS
jgi:hypothetical protein